MPIKAKYNGSYKDITDLMNVDESIDYVLAKTSSSYKRVYTATRSIEDTPPTTFKSIKPGANLTDYRIYGNTSKNILPLSKTPKTETIGDILCEYDGKGTFKFTSNVDNPTYTQDQWFWVPFEEDFDFPVGISDGGHGCIQLNNDFATGYGVTPYFVGFANRDNGEFVSGFNVAGTALNVVDTNYYTEDLEGLPANCIAFQYLQQIGKRTVTIKPALYLDIRTQQPFEPYGESVGDRTGNLCENSISGVNVTSNGFIYADIYNDVGYAKVVAGETYTINSYVYAFFEEEPKERDRSYDNGRVVGTSPSTFEAPINGYVAFRTESGSQLQCNEGNNLLPYEPYGYKVPMTVEGKNLAKNNYAQSSTLFAVEEVNNFIHVSGTNNSGSTKAYAISKENVFPAGSYDIVNNSDTGIGYDYRDENDTLVYGTLGANSIKTFDFPAVITRRLNIYKSVPNGVSIDNYFQVMIVKHGDDTNTYEPYHAPITTPIYLPEQIRKVGDEAEYIDYAEQKQHRVRKNLLPNTATSQTINGVTFTVNEDGSVTCNTDENGATEITYLVICKTPDIPESTNLILSGCPKGGSVSTYALQYSTWVDVAYTEIGNGESFTKYDYETYPTAKVVIRIYAGCVCDNLTFYPMIRNADITDDTYEPYIENTDVDVTLPALPTVTGTNVLSVGTEVQPSEIDITGHIKTISGGS